MPITVMSWARPISAARRLRLGHRLVQRHRPGHVVLRAEQAGLLQRGDEEQHAALRRVFWWANASAISSSMAQAGAVVDRTAVDLVTHQRRDRCPGGPSARCRPRLTGRAACPSPSPVRSATDVADPVGSAIDDVASIGTGLKPRFAALVAGASKSRPASANSGVAAAWVSQPATGRRGAGSTRGGRLNCGPRHCSAAR